MVTPGHKRHGRQATVNQQHGARLVAGQADGLIEQRLVRQRLAPARAPVSAHNHLGLGILDARRQRAAGKTAKHHAMNRPDAGAGQHGKGGLGNHRHVDQHAVAFSHAQRLQAGSHALHFGVQVSKGVGFFKAGFAGNGNQGRLISALFQVTVNRVVAQVGQPALEPARKRWVIVVADTVKRLVPLNQPCLLSPECIGLVNGLAVKLCVIAHILSPLRRP